MLDRPSAEVDHDTRLTGTQLSNGALGGSGRRSPLSCPGSSRREIPLVTDSSKG
jgi:hypothetical protein